MYQRRTGARVKSTMRITTPPLHSSVEGAIAERNTGRGQQENILERCPQFQDGRAWTIAAFATI
jgi:hypothetical protein